jgi:hypothetical protein
MLETVCLTDLVVPARLLRALVERVAAALAL